PKKSLSSSARFVDIEQRAISNFQRGNAMLIQRIESFTQASFAAAIVLGLTASVSHAQFGPGPDPKPEATLAAAPEGFDARRPGVAAGRVERIEFDSSVTNNKRPTTVYLPPGYSTERKY